MSSHRAHRRTFDVFGNSLFFHPKSGPDVAINSARTDSKLDLKFDYIQINKKWRFKIDGEHFKIEKYNDSSEVYETKLHIE